MEIQGSQVWKGRDVQKHAPVKELFKIIPLNLQNIGF